MHVLPLLVGQHDAAEVELAELAHPPRDQAERLLQRALEHEALEDLLEDLETRGVDASGAWWPWPHPTPRRWRGQQPRRAILVSRDIERGRGDVAESARPVPSSTPSRSPWSSRSFSSIPSSRPTSEEERASLRPARPQRRALPRRRPRHDRPRQGGRRARVLGRLDDRAPLPLRGLRGRPEPGDAQRVLGGGHRATSASGQLGYTMSAQNPIRVAEDTAILDHLTRGRCFVGFSRGYQARWTERPRPAPRHAGDPLPRRAHGRGPRRDGPGAARRARTRTTASTATSSRSTSTSSSRPGQADSIERPAGGRWEIPYPYDEGIEWGMHEATARARRRGRDRPRRPRAPRERRPRAVHRPAPAGLRRVQRQQGDRRVLRRQGLRPHVLLGHRPRRASSARPTSSTRRAGGRDFALGQNQALVRWMQIADTEEAAPQGDRGLRRRDLRQPLQGAHAGHAARPGRPGPVGHRLRAVDVRHARRWSATSSSPSGRSCRPSTSS